MEINQIRHFLAVTEKGSFTRAAQFTHISQPSLTQSIKRLEVELGGSLFLRDRAGCQLTALGRIVEPKFRQIYQQIQHTRQEAMQFSQLDRIPLRVGIMHTIGSNLLARYFAHFQSENPTTELELFVDGHESLVSLLQNGDLDMVITSPAIDAGAQFRCHKLYCEQYLFVFSSEHSLNKLESIDLEVLKKYPYLDRLNCEFRDDLTTLCSYKNIDLHAIYRSNNEHWILEMARQGAGVALMPEYSLPKHRTGLATRKLTDPELQREVVLLHASRPEYKKAVESMLACLSNNQPGIP